jgi:anhydro-N-acetylmuramic acid kinase
MAEYYVGLMSGTSMDALDLVLVDFAEHPLQLVAHLSHPLPAGLRQRLSDLTRADGNELERMAQADIHFGRFSAESIHELLSGSGIDPARIAAIGSHGQTIRHAPLASPPYTVQIGDGNTIAQATGITTVSDFRRRDMAAGGQGAPLVPAFHAALFRSSAGDRVVLNIGGIANISILPAAADAPVSGFDTGPGNMLLDGWSQQIRGEPYDEDGAWGRSGSVNLPLLDALLADPYFALAPPKSTGREHFNPGWLQNRLTRELPAEDVQATLVELSARSIAAAIDRYTPGRSEVLVCGGGAYNRYLMERLAAALPQSPLCTTEAYGLAPRWVEATAFAWLARQTMHHLPGNLPSVTGATDPVVLGAIHPGN